MTELGDTIDLLGLELSGVKVVMKDPGTMNRKRAGEYSPFSCQISLRREIVPYWFFTLATLRHEYNHHRHRWLVRGVLVLAILSALGSLAYASVTPSLWSTLPIVIVGFVTVFLKAFYIEPTAERYAQEHVPRIFNFLSDLEFVEIVEKHGKRKLPETLGDLYRGMKEYNPELLEQTRWP